jgi:hypothetical protein
MAARDAAAQLWTRTDLRPADVDVAQLYDGFSFLTLVWLEALGFCGRGEGGPFAGQLGKHGITVNCISPGVTMTEATKKVVPENLLGAVTFMTAMQRTLEPEDLAGAAVFFASDDASMVTDRSSASTAACTCPPEPPGPPWPALARLARAAPPSPRESAFSPHCVAKTQIVCSAPAGPVRLGTPENQGHGHGCG